MLSNDLFSYLDSYDPSSPAGSPCFDYKDSLQQQHFDTLSDIQHGNDIPSVELTEIQNDILQPRSVLTELTETSKVKLSKKLCGETPLKGTEINMGSDQEDDLVKYLTGEYEDTTPPWFKPVQKSAPEKCRTSSPVVVFKGNTEKEGSGPCMSRNAIAARETRQRKKEQMENLENTVKKLRSENFDLKKETEGMKTNIKELNEEVSYLKSVLANQSVLAGLLQNIQNTPGVRFQSSFMVSQNSKTPHPKKPTATVTGTVKVKSGKRKMHEEIVSGGKDAEESMKNKKTKHDHGYAAEPRGIHNSDPVRKRGDSRVPCHDSDVGPNCDNEAICSENAIEASGGVCLHVSNGSVSFEFCAVCSNKASLAQRKYDAGAEIDSRKM